MKVRKDPVIFINLWRFLNIGVLIHLWFIGEASMNAFILILLLLMMVTLRWRFNLPVWSVCFDIIICIFFMPSAVLGYFGIALPIYELALKGRGAFSVLAAVFLFVTPSGAGLLFWYYVLTLFFGIYSHVSLRNARQSQREADSERKARYEIEQMKTELIEANQTTAHQAELMERYRISRRLHDHLGHDLTGALLAFKAYEVMDDVEESEKLKNEIKLRLERSTENLRETVHNMTPTTLVGEEQIDDIVKNYRQLAIDYYKSGDMMSVPAYIWGLFVAYLKEALTNISRHSNATRTEVDLRVTESIVRLSVQDNGSGNKKSPAGSGLRSLQMRAKSMNGSLSINREDGYLLVCVIPLKKEERTDETADR